MTRKLKLNATAGNLRKAPPGDVTASVVVFGVTIAITDSTQVQL